MDINEIRKRAQQAREKAADAMKKTFEKSEELVNNLEVSSSEKEASISAAEAEEQIHASTERQVEILGQILGADGVAQMAVNEELLQKMVNEKVAEATASTTENLMGQLFGEDMGVLAAALEMLEMEDADEEEEPVWNLELSKTFILPWMKRWLGLRPSLSQNRFLTKKMTQNGNALASCCLVLYRPLTTTICIVWMWRNISQSWNRKSCPLYAAPGG